MTTSSSRRTGKRTAETDETDGTPPVTLDVPPAADSTGGPVVTTDSVPSSAPKPVEPEGPRGGSPTSYLNTSTGAVVYNRDGQSVAPGDWTPDVALDEIGRRARERGYLKPRSAL